MSTVCEPRYIDKADDLTPLHMAGFFHGWPTPPAPEKALAILQSSSHVWTARAASPAAPGREELVGFITALSDGVLSAYIPLLEVRAAWQGRGIGTALCKRMLDTLGGLYMVDLLCDADLQPFYSRLGMAPATGMMLRRRDRI